MKKKRKQFVARLTSLSNVNESNQRLEVQFRAKRKAMSEIQFLHKIPALRKNLDTSHYLSDKTKHNFTSHKFHIILLRVNV
jgi:hypothetical protein